MADKRGVKVAVDYLNSFFPIKLVAEELKARAVCTCMTDTLARKLRDNTNREDDSKKTPDGPFKGRVVVFYVPDADGRNDVAYYQGNRAFVAPPRKKKREDTPGVNPIYVKRAPAVFFFETLQKPGVYSPYYTSRAVMHQDALDKGLEAVYFTGSHEKPVRLGLR
jgi:hypothetical protein